MLTSTVLCALGAAAGVTAQAQSEKRAVTGNVPSGWMYTGCYTDNVPSRVLNGPSYRDGSGMTEQSCISFCDTRGYTIAGTEYSTECYCGYQIDSSSSKTPSSECSMKCSGDTSQDCGDSNRLTVFTSSGPGPVTAVGTNGWESMGCYTDSVSARTLSTNPSVHIDAGHMTVSACLSACKQNGFHYAGLEYANECYCDNSLHNNGAPASSGCSMTCNGNSSEFCGGPNRLNLYYLPSGASGSDSNGSPSSSVSSARSLQATSSRLTSTSTSSPTKSSSTSVETSILNILPFPVPTAASVAISAPNALSATGIASVVGGLPLVSNGPIPSILSASGIASAVGAVPPVGNGLVSSALSATGIVSAVGGLPLVSNGPVPSILSAIGIASGVGVPSVNIAPIPGALSATGVASAVGVVPTMGNGLVSSALPATGIASAVGGLPLVSNGPVPSILSATGIASAVGGVPSMNIIPIPGTLSAAGTVPSVGNGPVSNVLSATGIASAVGGLPSVNVATVPGALSATGIASAVGGVPSVGSGLVSSVLPATRVVSAVGGVPSANIIPIPGALSVMGAVPSLGNGLVSNVLSATGIASAVGGLPSMNIAPVPGVLSATGIVSAVGGLPSVNIAPVSSVLPATGIASAVAGVPSVGNGLISDALSATRVASAIGGVPSVNIGLVSSALSAANAVSTFVAGAVTNAGPAIPTGFITSIAPVANVIPAAVNNPIGGGGAAVSVGSDAGTSTTNQNVSRDLCYPNLDANWGYVDNGGFEAGLSPWAVNVVEGTVKTLVVGNGDQAIDGCYEMKIVPQSAAQFSIRGIEITQPLKRLYFRRKLLLEMYVGRESAAMSYSNPTIDVSLAGRNVGSFVACNGVSCPIVGNQGTKWQKVQMPVIYDPGWGLHPLDPLHPFAGTPILKIAVTWTDQGFNFPVMIDAISLTEAQ